jgi:hypothetical protein
VLVGIFKIVRRLKVLDLNKLEELVLSSVKRNTRPRCPVVFSRTMPTWSCLPINASGGSTRSMPDMPDAASRCRPSVDQ